MKYELVTIAEYSVVAAHSCSTKLFLLNLKFWKKKDRKASFFAVNLQKETLP